MVNPVDIVDIIKTPALIKDEFISAGSVVLDENQNPIHYTGGFAVVFPFYVNKEKWAFRCWYNNVGNIGERLNILSTELEKTKLPYFCKFQYVESGIVLNGLNRPTTRMLWVDGLNLKEYICQNARSIEKLKTFAANFKTMCHDLHALNIAHGDLQHGNIMVDDKGALFLIDYDSIFVPVLQGKSDIIVGLAAYQHPSRIRRENKYAHEKLDYFSELIIYTSILAITVSPSLVEDFDLAKSDNLLFKKEDYKDLKASTVYKTLIVLNNEIRLLLEILEDYLSKKSIVELKPFESYLSWTNESPYCIRCSNKYEEEEDLFCIQCGKKRI